MCCCGLVCIVAVCVVVVYFGVVYCSLLFVCCRLLLSFCEFGLLLVALLVAVVVDCCVL